MTTAREMIDTLRTPDALAARSASSRAFVLDFTGTLLEWAKRDRPLTEKQKAVLAKLYREAVTPAAATVDLAHGSAAIRAMFDRAGARLQVPAIRFSHDGLMVRVAKAGPQSRSAGSLWVTIPQEGDRGLYCGKIDQGGRFSPTREAPDGIVGALDAFARDPAGTAARTGHLTGRCFACWLKLSDARSTHVGYGATCAENWDLPYPTRASLVAEAA